MLPDGLEVGLTASTNDPDTDESSAHWRPDTDPSTTTDPRDCDSDDDGLMDGYDPSHPTLGEDLDRDGSRDATEADPNNYDTDGDGIFDGTEMGATSPTANTALAAGHYRADADPSKVTLAYDSDSDDDGINDGVEDLDKDGRMSTTAGSLETDASNYDTDGDGLSDGLENGYTVADAARIWPVPTGVPISTRPTIPTPVMPIPTTTDATTGLRMPPQRPCRRQRGRPPGLRHRR